MTTDKFGRTEAHAYRGSAPGGTAATGSAMEATVSDPYGTRRARALKVRQGVWLVFGVLETMLAIRFVLRVLGANVGSDFVAAVYGFTDPFVAPFVGMFPNQASGANVFEPHTAVAIVVYGLVAWLVATVAWMTLGEYRSATRTTSRETQSTVVDDQP